MAAGLTFHPATCRLATNPETVAALCAELVGVGQIFDLLEG